MPEISIFDAVKLLPPLLVIPAMWPLWFSKGTERINLAAWLVITSNCWIAAINNLIAQGLTWPTFYLLSGAIMVSPALWVHRHTGVWAALPKWHRIAAALLPAAAVVGVLVGGEAGTWVSVSVSVCLTMSLVSAIHTNVAEENPVTWSFFGLADLFALAGGWSQANLAYKALMSLWVLQCVLVLIYYAKNRIRENNTTAGGTSSG